LLNIRSLLLMLGEVAAGAIGRSAGSALASAQCGQVRNLVQPAVSQPAGAMPAPGQHRTQAAPALMAIGSPGERHSRAHGETQAYGSVY
jgi:hypothetical protein